MKYNVYPDYDPSIAHHASTAKERWGNPEENRKYLVKYGVPFLDAYMYGIDIEAGELLLVIGEEKKRKTTFFINTVVNIHTAKLPVIKPYTVIDSLESGMPPERYTDQIIANLASRYLMQNGHLPVSHGMCPACNEGRVCQELTLTPKFLRYMNRSPQQGIVIDRALDEVSGWSLDIWGASLKEGDTRNLYAAVGKMNQTSRWVWAVEELGAKLFATDHIQQYDFEEGILSDYEKQVRSVLKMGSFVAAYKVAVFMLSQVSMTTLRAEKAGGKVKAAGGKKSHEEANGIIRTTYEQMSGLLGVHLEDSRSSSTGSAQIPIDDVSGAYCPIEETD